MSLATEDDIPALIAIFWEAFSGPGEATFPHTDGGRAWLERGFRNFLGGPSYYRPESRVPVVRNANGTCAFSFLFLSFFFALKISTTYEKPTNQQYEPRTICFAPRRGGLPW